MGAQLHKMVNSSVKYYGSFCKIDEWIEMPIPEQQGGGIKMSFDVKFNN